MNKSKIVLSHRRRTTDLMMNMLNNKIKNNWINNCGLINMIQKVILIFLPMKLKIGMFLRGSRVGMTLFFLKKKSSIRFKSKNRKMMQDLFLKEIICLNNLIKVGNNIINFHKWNIHIRINDCWHFMGLRELERQLWLKF
jgi:hypothetical protein